MMVIGINSDQQRETHWVEEHFERKHSGLHRGMLLATIVSLAIWGIVLALII